MIVLILNYSKNIEKLVFSETFFGINFVSKAQERRIIITLEYAVPELEQSLSKLVTLKEGQIILPHDMMLLNSILKLIYKYNCEIKEITVSDSIEELFRG